MKILGTQQFLEKKYQLLGIAQPEWRGLLGDLPHAFTGIAYGNSGNGKTELTVRLAMLLTHFDRAGWLSYEQGHGYDLRRALERNKHLQGKHAISWVDPLAKRKQGVSLFESLDAYLSKRSTPKYLFLDSLDYLRLTTEQYFILKEKYSHKKGIIFVSHAKGRLPKSGVGQDIMYDGGFGIYVKNFIAFPEKNRFGGTEPLIIWEEKAREKYPLFFEKQIAGSATRKSKSRRTKKTTANE